MDLNIYIVAIAVAVILIVGIILSKVVGCGLQILKFAIILGLIVYVGYLASVYVPFVHDIFIK